MFLHLRETAEKKKTCVVLLPYGPSCYTTCSEFLHQSFDFLRVFLHLAEGCFCFSRRAFSQQFFHPKAPYIWTKTHIICYPIEGTGEERLLWFFRHRSKISNDIEKSGNISQIGDLPILFHPFSPCRLCLHHGAVHRLSTLFRGSLGDP